MLDILAFVFAAGTLSVPDPSILFQPQDFQSGPDVQTQSFVVDLELTIDPTGAVVQCRAETRLGPKVNFDRYCTIAKGRRLQPATSRAGLPEYFHLQSTLKFVYPNTRNWKMVDNFQSDPQVVIQLDDRSLPRKGLRTSIMVLVDETGRVLECAPSPFLEPKFAKTAAAACPSSNQFDLPPLRGPNDLLIRRVELISLLAIPLRRP